MRDWSFAQLNEAIQQKKTLIRLIESTRQFIITRRDKTQFESQLQEPQRQLRELRSERRRRLLEWPIAQLMASVTEDYHFRRLMLTYIIAKRITPILLCDLSRENKSIEQLESMILDLQMLLDSGVTRLALHVDIGAMQRKMRELNVLISEKIEAERTLAIMMATQCRLGKESGLRTLGDDLLHTISKS